MFFLVVLATAPGLRADSLFDPSLYAKYEKAFQLNEQGKYLEAYQAMTDVHNDMLSVMQQRGVNLSTLDVTDFKVFYWPVTRSLAEISYKLGLHTTVASLTAQMRTALLSRSDIGASIADGMNADLKRLDGCSHFLSGDYLSAERELMASLRLKPDDYEFTNAVHDDLAQLYYKQENYLEALSHIKTILESAPFREGYRFPVDERKRLDIESQYALCLARCGYFHEALEQIDKILKRYNKKRNPQEYAEALRKKAKMLALQEEQSGSRNTATVQCYKEYLQITKSYVDNHFIDLTEAEREQYWATEYPFVTDCYRLEERDPGMLYDVSLFSKAVLLLAERQFKADMSRMQRKKALASARITWRDLQKKLPDSVAAIEFISYEKGDDEYLGALVLRRKFKAPKFVPIAPMADIRDHVSYKGLSVREILFAPSDGSDMDSLYKDRQLQSLIWNEQLVREIGNVKNVYFAPDGIFHQLEIEYLLPESLRGKRFFRMTSTRMLAERRQKTRSGRMLMMGGVDYHSASDDKKEASGWNDWLAYRLMSLLRLNYTEESLLPNIPGTMEEVNAIKQLRNAPQDTTLIGEAATESRLKALMNNYPIVHLSTHGYFDEAITVGFDIRPTYADLQLSHNCLFLSGSRRNIFNEYFNASQPDGILSARELSRMDLSGVDLMVMSACQSGLGYITTDGVFGLQRGLKSAGVKSIIASLWEVDDDAAVCFMKLFYSKLNSGMSLYDAFAQARNELRRCTVRRRWDPSYVVSLDNPYYYNAFILIDGIE